MGQRICSIKGCGKPHKAHGWCSAHYSRYLRHGDPLAGGAARKTREIPDCSVAGCGQPSYGHGLCGMHLYRKTNNGDVGGAQRIRESDPEVSFLSKTRADGDCLVWTGSLNADGYGQIHVGREKQRAHRYAWERERGPIPDGMQVDHACWNRACVKIDHLRLASTQENSYNRSGPSRNNALGIRNVYPHSGGFAVQVRKRGRAHGTWHRELEDAVAEAEMLRERLFGEFAGAGTRATEYETGDQA